MLVPPALPRAFDRKLRLAWPRSGILPALALLFIGVSGASMATTAAAPIQPAPLCAAHVASLQFADPPDVDMWKLPTNAEGEHELILAVHRDHARFCYRYTLDGTANSVPPTIRVRRGEHFALRIVNDIKTQSKGEFVPSSALPKCGPMQMSASMPMPMGAPRVTHFVGYLNHTIDDRYIAAKPVDTNIHLHGFEGPAEQENVFLSTLSTPMHACEYHVTIPKTQPPGTYFYHPHVHGASESEVARGLSGAWIVEPDAPLLDRSAEHVIVLRYRLPFANENPFAPDPTPIFVAGAIHEAMLKPGKPVAYDPFNPPAWPTSYPIRGGGVSFDPSGCSGIQSDTVLSVNGYNTPAALDLPAGRPQLLRILNATSDSLELLKLRDGAGNTVPLHVTEIDGVPVSGDTEHPVSHYRVMNEVMLPAAGRVSALVTPAPGQVLTLYSRPFCAGTGYFFEGSRDLLRLAATATTTGDQSPAIDPTEVSASDGPATKLMAYARAHPSMIHRRAITFTEYSLPPKGKTIPPHAGYYVTDTTNPNFREHSFWPEFDAGASTPSNADIVVKAGTVEEWYLFNTTLEPHVFHMHQMAFVEENGRGAPLTADTIMLPVGKLLPNPNAPDYPLIQPSVTKALMDFRNVPRGTFLFHCHLLFHEDNGMMAIIKVV